MKEKKACVLVRRWEVEGGAVTGGNQEEVIPLFLVRRGDTYKQISLQKDNLHPVSQLLHQPLLKIISSK